MNDHSFLFRSQFVVVHASLIEGCFYCLILINCDMFFPITILLVQKGLLREQVKIEYYMNDSIIHDNGDVCL